MDEIEYKLNTNNSVLVVNAVDKLISTIKSKFRLAERQRFVLENEELKFLRNKCSSKDNMVSLTACQGLLALVELGILEIGHTMSTVVTLLPRTHNYTAMISVIAGLLTLDLKSRLIPGQPYTCQFTLRSPQHPFITVLEKNEQAEDIVIDQMYALCNHPDYIISYNAPELLRPVFLYMACSQQSRQRSIRPWRILLNLPRDELLLACLSCLQICNPSVVEHCLAVYSTVVEDALSSRQGGRVAAMVPFLARVSKELLVNGRDPRSCYNLLERCFALEVAELRHVAGLTIMLLAENLIQTSALYLHELFNLCLNIISKYDYSTISLNVFASLSLQWLNLPSYLTSASLKVAAKILEVYQTQAEDSRLYAANLKSNITFQTLLYTESHLSVIFKLNHTWERIKDNPAKLKRWLDSLKSVDDELKMEMMPFLIGIMMERREDASFEEVVVKVVGVLTGLVGVKTGVAVHILPILLFKIANDNSPKVKIECLKALPLMAKIKENVPTIVSLLTKLKTRKGVPTSFLIKLYSILVDTQVRCFPYLLELVVDPGAGRPDDLKWEVDIARAAAVRRICEIRPSTQGLELVPVISSILNKCTDKAGCVATCLSLSSLGHLWRASAVSPTGAWRALEPRLAKDGRPAVQISICALLSEIPALRVPTPDYDKLTCECWSQLWHYVAGSESLEVVVAACDALHGYRPDDHSLRDLPEIYRRTVQLPPSYCKTPADAARRPEDVLDYIPCEIWPELFKCTNQSALPAVQRLVSRMCEREIKAYRSGVYQPDARIEPQNACYLPASSVVRGLLECFRKQATSPTYEYRDTVLLSILATLSSEYPKPLPPVDLCFLHSVFHRGEAWRKGCVALAARQAFTSGSAKRFVENYLRGVEANAEESDILLIFELLPILCRCMPPNSLRPILERSLGESYFAIANVKKIKTKRLRGYIEGDSNEMEKQSEEYMFIKQLEMIEQCLKCDKIHEANRTLLSQLVENYFTVIKDDNVAWWTYQRVCTALSTKYLERMTSPSSWWECDAALLRSACRVRSAVAGGGEGEGGEERGGTLVWLNEVVDAIAGEVTVQEFSLKCMLAPLRAASPGNKATKDWFLQLLARTQVAFKETDDTTAKQYLCDVFMLTVIVISGHWSLECDVTELTANRSARREILPAAAASLVARVDWQDCALQLLEWLVHTRDTIGDANTAECCQRCLLAARHANAFAEHRVWKRLERHYGMKKPDLDD